MEAEFNKKLQSQEPTLVSINVDENITKHIASVQSLTDNTLRQMKTMNDEFIKLKGQLNTLSSIDSNLAKTHTTEINLKTKLENLPKSVPKLNSSQERSDLVLQEIDSPRSETSGISGSIASPANSPRGTAAPQRTTIAPQKSTAAPSPLNPRELLRRPSSGNK
jgi:chromosome segregation ATPase